MTSPRSSSTSQGRQDKTDNWKSWMRLIDRKGAILNVYWICSNYWADSNQCCRILPRHPETRQMIDPRFSYSTDGILGYAFTAVSLNRVECLILLVLCQSSLSLQVNFDQICIIPCAFALTLLEFCFSSSVSWEDTRHVIVWCCLKRDAQDYMFICMDKYKTRLYV